MADEVIDSVKEFTDILGEEDEVINPDGSDDAEESEELEEDEESKEEKEGDEEEGKEDDDKQYGTIEIPSFKEVTKKYPNLFKDFPHFRHVFAHAKEYRELFPTIDDAKEALDNLKTLDDLESHLEGGKPEDTIKVLQSIKELGEDALTNLSGNFLKSLRKMDQDLYYQVITPELVNFTRSMFDAGLRNENENLQNAAKVAALHFFGDQKVASGEKEIKLPNAKKETPKDDKLERERQSFKQERYTTFYNDVVSDADGQLSELIIEGIDPKDQMSDGMKELATEKVIKEITEILASNPQHSKRMDSLWKRASDDNFSKVHKSKIISAYLEAAKDIMPRIRAKVRANVLGIRERHSEEKPGSVKKRVEPKGSAGNGSSRSKIVVDDPKKIDWKKTSDKDFLNDKVVLKS